MIIIIGAGISGLTLAYQLQKANKPFLLLEKCLSAGGFLQTINIDHYLLELGPNSFLADVELIDFFNELGLGNEIQFSADVGKSRYIFKNGSYKKLPDSPLSLLFSGFFSFNTKLAILQELSRSKQQIPNETLGAFFERRFSREIVDYALDPFISGIYAGDVNKLSLEATFPSLKKFETESGSVLRGFLKNSKNTARKKSLNFKSGMQTITNQLFSKVNKNNIELGSEVKEIAKSNEGWELTAFKNNVKTTLKATEIVFCLPAYKVDELLNYAHTQHLSKIRYVPMGVVHTVYNKKDIAHALDGFGGLNPSIENQFSLGSIWTSSIFPDRCGPQEVLFTTFIGGDKQGHKLINNQPSEIKLKVHTELAKNFKIKAPQPVFQHFHQWDKALPQYENFILEAWQEVNRWEKDGLFVCSNWKDGVSLSDCIKKSTTLATKLPGE